MRSFLCLSALIVVAGCGGSSGPTAPTPAQPITLTGHLRATNGGQPIAGASVRTVSGETASTDAAGVFRLSVLPTSILRLTINGANLTREVSVHAGQARDVDVEAFVENATFDLTYFRQIARGAISRPSGEPLQPIRRWTEHPRIYVRTVNEHGATISATNVSRTIDAISAMVPVWTADRFQVAEVLQGTETREGVPGWITVKFLADPPTLTTCGFTQIGQSGGWMELHYTNFAGCWCGGIDQIGQAIVRHEIGHAMGLWHTDTRGELMAPGTMGRSPCDQTLPTAREQLYARYLYTRPVGNTDPDSDPMTAVQIRPITIQ